MNGDEELKARAREILVPELMSSDESDMSEDEDGNVTVKGYMVKQLPWESSTLKKIKSYLDQKYRSKFNLVELGVVYC